MGDDKWGGRFTRRNKTVTTNRPMILHRRLQYHAWRRCLRPLKKGGGFSGGPDFFGSNAVSQTCANEGPMRERVGGVGERHTLGILWG